MEEREKERENEDRERGMMAKGERCKDNTRGGRENKGGREGRAVKVSGRWQWQWQMGWW
jgi:hypothetical protein